MAAHLDVTGRLAEGQPAADTIQIYVSACAALGFEQPELTAHAGQVDDWYGTEAGLDLRALDADCARLQGAMAATEQARDLQDGQAGALAESWTGLGAQSALDFLRRHSEASAMAAAAVRVAAEALAELRDGLWRSVDAKVSATQAVADRAASTEWRSAAETVLTGSGDRVTANELVDLRVKPFVSDDIGSDWVTAMRSGTDEVAASYDAATAELTADPAPVFEVPADWGPTQTPVAVPTTPAGVAEPARVAEASAESADDSTSSAGSPAGGGSPTWGGPPAWSAPAGGGAPWSSEPPSASEPPTAMAPPGPAVEPGGAAPASSPVPALGGLPDIGSGLTGMGKQFADMLGGLLGSSGDSPPGLDEPESPDIEDAASDDGEPGEESEQDGGESEFGAGAVNSAGGGGTPMGTEAAGSIPEAACPEPASSAPAEETPAEPAPAADRPVEPSPTPTPPAEPLAAEQPPPQDSPADDAATPCEIAADEVPQAGE